MAVLTRRMTEEEFMRLPDDGRRYELVDGEPKVVPTNQDHDLILGRLYRAVWPASEDRGIIGLGQTGFRMVSANVRVPDLAFTLNQRASDTKAYGNAAPDLCVEIISPSEEPADMARKVREYFASGAQIVWQMFAETETIKVYTSPDDFTIYTAEQVIDCAGLLPGFRIRVADLFKKK